MKPRLVHKISLIEALDRMSGGQLNHISLTIPKVRELSDRLITEGYNPYEFLIYFANEYIGIGGWSQLRFINKWTSDKVWLDFIAYKKRTREETGRWYSIQMAEVNTRLNNNLSTKTEILETDIVAADIIVRLDLSVRWRNDDPKIKKYLDKNWDIGILHLMALPEYLPHTHALTEFLIQQGSVEYV